MSDDDIRPQKVFLQAQVDAAPNPSAMGSLRNLDTVLYTAAENGMLGDFDSLDSDTAVKIWKLVELSGRFSNQEIEAIEM